MSVHAASQAIGATDDDVDDARGRSRVWQTLRRDPSFWIGLIAAILIIGAAILAPLLAPHDPNQQFRAQGRTPKGDPVGPSALFPLGTDTLGRDYLSRLLFGAQASLTVGLGANLIATIIGVTVGSIAAFVGTPRLRFQVAGRLLDIGIPVEGLLMRITDAVLSFPALLLAIALVAVLGPSLGIVIGVIAAVLWTGIARIVYSRVIVIRETEFVLAARALGVGSRRLLVRHVMPHLISLVLVYATLGIASTVLFEATLSFQGVGIPPPGASWGREIYEGLGYYVTDPRLVVLPGIAIMITILAFNLLGDALADAFDPHHWR